jgi:phosphatidylserine/phosphatidylglycerophosphate/cardiolipin synthase-like enzyme
MHAKYFIIDGKEAWVGSQNFDWRSLEHITELGLRFDEPAAVQGLQAIFQMDWARAGGQSIAPVDLPDTPAPTTFAGQPVTLRLVGSPQSALPDPAMWDWPALQAMLRSAKSRIRLQVMSYELKLRDGGYWDELDRELRAAAARGVKVELILGQWGRKGHKLEAAQSLDIMENIDVRYVVIPDWSGGRIDFARVVHSKYLVVDGEHSWVGTSNASGDYFLQSRNVGLLIEGKAMGAALDDYFERHWNSPYASGAMEQQK